VTDEYPSGEAGAAQRCVAADERRGENGRRSQLNAVFDDYL
jgi:hypothetical protein